MKRTLRFAYENVARSELATVCLRFRNGHYNMRPLAARWHILCSRLCFFLLLTTISISQELISLLTWSKIIFGRLFFTYALDLCKYVFVCMYTLTGNLEIRYVLWIRSQKKRRRDSMMRINVSLTSCI